MLMRPSSCCDRFVPNSVDLEVVEAELQLIVIEPFGAPAKLAALQLLNNEPEAFDLRLRRSKVDAFGRASGPSAAACLHHLAKRQDRCS
jgi:hypothetical protein